MLKKVLVLMLLIAVMVPSYAVMGMEEDEPISPKVFIPKEMISDVELLDGYSERSDRQEKPRISLYASNQEICGYITYAGGTILGLHPLGRVASAAYGAFGMWYCTSVVKN